MYFLEVHSLFPARGIFFTGALSFDFERKENGWEYLERNFSIKREDVVLPVQEHTSVVLFDENPSSPSDGVFISTPGKGAGVLTADCVPLLFLLPNKAIGAVHAGWRGLKNRIVEKAIREASIHYRVPPEDFAVAIGPSAGSCCYEIKEDVESAFIKAGYGEFIERRNGIFLNMKRVAEIQCRASGVKKIEVIERCTICDRRFHSWRRGSKGKMLSLVFFPSR